MSAVLLVDSATASLLTENALDDDCNFVPRNISKAILVKEFKHLSHRGLFADG